MVKQLSVFLQNRSGKIAAITDALAEADIDIRALSVADTTDFGILRMLVDDIERAQEVLARQSCIVCVNEVVVVAVPDAPGGLAKMLSLIAHNGIDIEYMYSLIDRAAKDAYMVFRVTDEERLLALLGGNGLHAVAPHVLGLH